MQIEDLLAFVKESDLLKRVERQTLIHNGGRRENSAEHSWHLALTALVFAKFAPKNLDLFKAVKMALMHDIVEIDAGDTIVYGHQPGKKAAESAALERIMGLLPVELDSDLASIWREFEDGESLEAKYISALDRFLPIYSNYLNDGHSWKNHSIASSRVTDKCEPLIAGSMPELWALAKKMIDESVASGDLAP
jgi:putative hydrolases of HD superfamily